MYLIIVIFYSNIFCIVSFEHYILLSLLSAIFLQFLFNMNTYMLYMPKTIFWFYLVIKADKVCAFINPLNCIYMHTIEQLVSLSRTQLYVQG